MLGKIEGRKRRRQERVKWLDGIISSMLMNLRKLGELVKDGEGCLTVVHRVGKSWTSLSD